MMLGTARRPSVYSKHETKNDLRPDVIYQTICFTYKDKFVHQLLYGCVKKRK